MSYTAYRPIDELWLTTIPKHWDCKKIKYIFSERVEKGYPNEPLLVASQNMGVVPKDVYGSRTVEAMKDLHNLKLVRIGDFVISLRSFQGGIEYAYYQGIISPAYTVMIPNDYIASGYFRFLSKSKLFIELLQMCVTGIREGQNVDYNKLKNHLIPLPPCDEQEKIVQFLDWKISQINKLIKTKQRKIELLQEQRQTMIDEILMGGGDGWEEKPLKYWAHSNLSSIDSNTSSDFEIEYLDISSVGHGYLKQAPTKYFFADAPSRARRLVRFGDTIISTVRTYLRSVCYINHDIEHCVVSTGFSVLTPNDKIVLPELLSFAVSTDYFVNEVIRNSIGVSYPAINDNKLMSLKIGLPISMETQIKLYESLNIRFLKLDVMISKYKKEIDTITEYRTALISHIISGKIDVRSESVLENKMISEVVTVNITENKDVATETKIITFPTSVAKPKGHNPHFDDAVMIAGIVNAFYHEKYRLGRKKVQKLLYLLRRHQEESIAAFKKKAAGPYADEVRYKGGEPIAKKNKYIATTTTVKGTTFARGEKIIQALEYIEKWGEQDDVQWLINNFRYTKVDDLELLATVDMAICDLNEVGIPIDLKSIKHLIATNKEWQAKLKKQTFSDDMISKAIGDLEKLLGDVE